MHYTFVEIGTSDFDTCLQDSTNDDYGLSVDAVGHYLQRLPTKSNVRKIHAGISNKDGFIDVYYVHPDTIAIFNLVPWVRGCNSIGAPHPTVVKLLGSMGLPLSLIQKETVVVKSIFTLFSENDVESIDYLKVDTEGHDCIILNNYIDYCLTNPKTFAKKIRFETNVLSTTVDQDFVLNRFLKNGYAIVSRDTDDAVLERV
jgi:hypothetical protein